MFRLFLFVEKLEGAFVLTPLTPIYNFNNQNNSIKSRVNTKPETSFNGLAKFVQSSPQKVMPFYTTDYFERIASCFKSKIAGTIPPEFLKLYPDNPRKVFDFFEQFAQFAKESNFPVQYSQSFKVKLSSGENLDAKYLDFGSYGLCFKIKMQDNKTYVLKSFYDNYDDLEVGEKELHGAVAEVRSGLNLSGTDYKDMAKWHIGSVKENQAWQLMEYLDIETSTQKRSGVLVQQARPDLKFTDGPRADVPSHNVVGGVRFDLGGIHHKHEKIPNTIARPFMYNFNCFSNKLKKYKNLLDDPSVKNKAEIPTVLKWIFQNDVVEGFYATLNHPNSEVKAKLAKQIECLPYKDRKDAFYSILNHSDKKIKQGLGYQVQHLNDVDKREAFITILNHPDEKVRQGLAKSLRWLARAEQRDLFESLYQKDFPTFRLEF